MAESRTLLLKTCCVYSGSAEGKGESYIKAATALGEERARRDLKLVYGGGSIGLVGAIVRSFQEHSGHQSAIAIILRDLTPFEIIGTTLDNTIEVETMHERKVRLLSRLFPTLFYLDAYA